MMRPLITFFSVVYTHAPSSVVVVVVHTLETAWPINAKLHVAHPSEDGTKVCINGPRHRSKMAVMAMNSKNQYYKFSHLNKKFI